jgi:ferredoxin hydrogenase large subunit/hydrogenase large subunit
MSKMLDLDPVTRIEGHLAIRVAVEGGKVVDAFSCGEMFRGVETIVRGRHPMDAQQITQRICGVCPIEHGIASVRAQDQAYGVKPPPNGRLLRNIIGAANYLHSHLAHFYLLSAVDFVDVTAILGYAGKDSGMMELRDWVKQQVESKVYLPAAPFLPRYETKYLDDKEANLGLLKNYLSAMDVRRTCHELGALFAGRMPHVASLIPGGVSQTLDAQRIAAAEAYLGKIRAFVEQCYIPDAFAVTAKFPEYWSMGRGCQNFLAYGCFPENDAETEKLTPAGVLIDGRLTELDIAQITEDASHAWFQDGAAQHPTKGETEPKPGKSGAYSWVKAPRYHGKALEVGPLARMIVGYQRGNPRIKALVDSGLAKAGRKLEDLPSVMGRHFTRAIEAQMVVDGMKRWLAALRPDEPVCVPFRIPSECQGVGLTEAARGALGHWLQVKGGKIDRYQCVVPTTWNCSPKDAAGVPGPVEQALIGSTIADEANPIETVRIVRSFDPCLACAVH